MRLNKRHTNIIDLFVIFYIGGFLINGQEGTTSKSIICWHCDSNVVFALHFSSLGGKDHLSSKYEFSVQNGSFNLGIKNPINLHFLGKTQK